MYSSRWVKILLDYNSKYKGKSSSMFWDMSLWPPEKDETDIYWIHRWEYQSVPSGHAIGSSIQSLKVPGPLNGPSKPHLNRCARSYWMVVFWCKTLPLCFQLFHWYSRLIISCRTGHFIQSIDTNTSVLFPIAFYFGVFEFTGMLWSGCTERARVDYLGQAVRVQNFSRESLKIKQFVVLPVTL